jgi:threonyl-tRNA synthetase
VWLAPVQARVLPVSEKFLDYAREVVATMQAAGLRVALDESDEKLGYKIRRTEMDRIAYALVVGGRETETRTVGVRRRHAGDLGAMTLDTVIDRIRTEADTRAR